MIERMEPDWTLFEPLIRPVLLQFYANLDILRIPTTVSKHNAGWMFSMFSIGYPTSTHML